MNQKTFNNLGSTIHELRRVTVVSNYNDCRNLDLLIQNFISIQQLLTNDKVSPCTVKHLSILEKEAEYFLARYAR